MAGSDAEHTGGLPPLPVVVPLSVTVQAMARTLVGGRPDTWGDIEVARRPQDCLPGLTMCSEVECMQAWLDDFYLRVLTHGMVSWTSPDAPAAAHASEVSPVLGGNVGGVVIPLPRR